MRGRTDEPPALFHTFRVENRIRADHPLRDVERRADRILASLSAEFAECTSRIGRPSVPPERQLKAQLLLALYTIRSERQLRERIDTDPLFHGFLDWQPSEEAFDPAVFSHDRKRLDDGGGGSLHRRPGPRALPRGRHAHRELRFGQEFPADPRGIAE